MAKKKSYRVKMSAIAKDLDRALKALAQIEKKKATLVPDDAERLAQGVQDLSQARELVLAACGRRMTAVFSSGPGA